MLQAPEEKLPLPNRASLALYLEISARFLGSLRKHTQGLRDLVANLAHYVGTAAPEDAEARLTDTKTHHVIDTNTC
jgi:hypothetical protein